jgi:hypothetical protein
LNWRNIAGSKAQGPDETSIAALLSACFARGAGPAPDPLLGSIGARVREFVLQHAVLPESKRGKRGQGTLIAFP